MKIGFDNDKYLSMQSEHIRERIGQFGDKLIWNLEESCLMTTTPPGFFPASHLTASFGCSFSWPTRLRSSL